MAYKKAFSPMHDKVCMPKITKPLTPTTINNLKPKESRYPKSDGGCVGLFIEVMPSGSKIWRYRYTLNGARSAPVTIGNYPDVSIEAARERGRKYAAQVAAGASPVAEARKDRGVAVSLDVVRIFAEHWHGSQIANKSADYSKTVRRVLDKDVLPFIGNKTLSSVTSGDVLAICERIKGRGSDQAALLARNVVKRMYDYAVAQQLVTVNPAALLVSRFVAKQSSRERVLSPDEVGKLFRAVYKSDMARPNKLALHLLCLTMVRKSELLNAEWSEFDLEAGVWRIPAERMKMSAEHWIYLSAQAVSMFQELRELSFNGRYVFPTRQGREDKPVSKSILNNAISALNLGVDGFVIHDLRRTASTHLNEMGYPSDAIEKALAHTIKGVRGVYNRAQYSAERKRMLQAWADFVDAQIESGRKVVIGNFAKAG